eukprot:10593072-Alexandrium_andersonii.AAC.1
MMAATAAANVCRMHPDLEPSPHREGGKPKRRPEIADGPVSRCSRDDARHARHLSYAQKTGRRGKHYVAKARRPRHNRDTLGQPHDDPLPPRWTPPRCSAGDTNYFGKILAHNIQQADVLQTVRVP